MCSGGFPLKDYIEERAISIAKYIIDNNATVRQTAKQFGISKSTVHVEVTMRNGGKVRLFGWLNSGKVGAMETYHTMRLFHI